MQPLFLYTKHYRNALYIENAYAKT